MGSCVPQEYRDLQRPEESVRSSGTGVTGVVSLHVGIKPVSSTRVGSALNCWAIVPALDSLLLKNQGSTKSPGDGIQEHNENLGGSGEIDECCRYTYKNI